MNRLIIIAVVWQFAAILFAALGAKDISICLFLASLFALALGNHADIVRGK